MSLLPPPAPQQDPSGARHRGLRTWALIAGAVMLIAVAGGGGYAASQYTGRTATAAATRVDSPARSDAPLEVVSTSPTSTVASDATITVDFSTPVSLGGVTPTFAPPVAGSWQRVTATSIEFVPSGPLMPSVTETMTIPGGPGGMMAENGSALPQTTTVNFGVQTGDTLRLQQLLAQLDYLPLTFAPTGPAPPVTQTALDQPGTFTWRWPGFPSALTSLWTAGQANVITEAAVMSLEEHDGLNPDGEAGPKVWEDLLRDVTAGAIDTADYTYALVSKTLPENLTVYDNGSARYSNVLVNTGVRGAVTADGTFVVFEHVTSSRMVGTNPDGTHYDDPHVPWASYFNGGDALHGFVRASYGYPQSNGCVEMPVSTAASIYPLTPVGTLVTVEG